MKKKKVAIVKLYGMSSSGTSKFLQTIAKNLDRKKFEVFLFYSEKLDYVGAKCDFEIVNRDILKEMKTYKHVKLIPFYAKIDLSHPYKKWIETDFWEKFNEDDFDLIQIAKHSWPQYPFYKVKKIPIIDSVHYIGKLVDNQYNISKVINISKWSEDWWVKNGGDRKRSVVIYHPIEIIEEDKEDLRKKLKLNKKFIFGFHQRVSDGIFSKIPLEAYKRIEVENTHFIVLGGSKLYSKQAKKLKLKNFIQLEPTGDKNKINQFLRTLNVYSHGRFDGETFGRVLGEAMYFSLPIISHKSNRDNGHIEVVGNGGVVCENDNIEQYSNEMKKLMIDKRYYKMRSKNSKKRFDENYRLKIQIKKIENLYEEVLNNPYQHSFRRILFLVEPIQAFKKILLFSYFKLKSIGKKSGEEEKR